MLRVGTNSPASAESVLFSNARDAGILKQSQLDVEVIFIAGGTLSMQLALDDIAKDNPKAKNLTVQRLIDLSFLP